MRKLSIEISRKSFPEKTVVEARLEEDEVTRLQTFYDQAEALTALSVLRTGMPGNLKICYEKGKELTFTGSLPPEESILALLHRLRPFILNDEFASYNRVTGILRKRFDESGIRSILKRQRQVYDGREFQNQIQLVANGVVLNSEQTLFDWLNSFEYHNDQSKKRELEKLHELMSREASRVIFFMLLTDKVRAILNIADFVGLLLGKEKSFEARL